MEELDEDEKVSYLKKIKDAADQEAHRKSALIIYRFIKSFMLWKRLPQLKKCCILQVERELFASSVISNAMCGVCGVGFEKSSTGEVEESVVHDGEEEEEKESGEIVQERIKQEHLDSEGHKRNAAEYQTFRQIYRSHLAMPLFNIRGSLSFHQVKIQEILSFRVSLKSVAVCLNFSICIELFQDTSMCFCFTFLVNLLAFYLYVYSQSVRSFDTLNHHLHLHRLYTTSLAQPVVGSTSVCMHPVC